MSGNAEALQQSGQAAEADFSEKEAGATETRCGSGEKTWVEVQMIGEDGKPLPGERYRLELPDGTVKEGSLDAEGTVGFETIDPGACKLTFPDLDEEAWEAAEEAG